MFILSASQGSHFRIHKFLQTKITQNTWTFTNKQTLHKILQGVIYKEKGMNT